jgi:hypothetical protein
MKRKHHGRSETLYFEVEKERGRNVSFLEGSQVPPFALLIRAVRMRRG